MPLVVLRPQVDPEHVHEPRRRPKVTTLVLDVPMPEGCENTADIERRGWCVFESGVCVVVLAHLAQAEKGVAMPERLARAQAARPKLTQLEDDGSAVAVAPTGECSSELMAQLQARVHATRAQRRANNTCTTSSWLPLHTHTHKRTAHTMCTRA